MKKNRAHKRSYEVVVEAGSGGNWKRVAGEVFRSLKKAEGYARRFEGTTCAIHIYKGWLWWG